MNNIMVSDNIKIENMIYEIRGKQVMLDFDLATLYGCKNGTKEINQAVKNNIEKFPERYCFRITEKEYSSLKSKVLTSRGGSRKGHTVFTEQGIYASYYSKRKVSDFYNNRYNGCLCSNEKYNKYFTDRAKIY